MDIRIIASGSSGNAYRVSDGETALLLDAGVPMREIEVACGFRVREIAGCFITHCHQDHAKAATELARRGTDIYTSSGTAAACGLTGHRIRVVKALEEITVGTFKVLPFDVQHDVPEPLGFLLTSTATGEKLLYFTDTYYVKYRFSGLTHMMVEANYDAAIAVTNMAEGRVDKTRTKRLMESHMSIKHLEEFLRANDLSRVRQIYLLHLSNDNSDAGRFKQTVQRLTGAEVYVG